MNQATAIPVRLAVLADAAAMPAARTAHAGVGVWTLEQLLAVWAGGPVVLGRRDDGSHLLTGAEDKHVGIAEVAGFSAVAMAAAPVGVGLAPIAEPSKERTLQAALLAALKDAEHGRGRINIGGPGTAATHLPQGLADVVWRPWVALGSPVSPAPARLLASPLAALTVLAGHDLAVGAISTPTGGGLAVAVAWSAPA